MGWTGWLVTVYVISSVGLGAFVLSDLHWQRRAIRRWRSNFGPPLR